MRFVSALSFVACLCFTSVAIAQPATDPDAGAPAPAPDAPPPAPPAAEAAPPPPSEPAPPAAEPPVTPPPETPPPAPTAPPSSTPPVTTAPVSGPYFQPTVAPGAEAGVSEDKPAPPPESTIAFELDGGLHRRMGDSTDYGFETREAGGVSFGPAIWLSPERLWAAGLSYRRLGLGLDRSTPGDNSLTVRRRLDVIWLGGRAFPWRSDVVGFYILLQLGMSWQHADADGTRLTQEFLRPAESYTCSANSGPGFALGGGVGLDVDIEDNLSFIMQVDATAHRHTSETIDSCTPGSGSVTNLGANIGFAYKLDLDPGATARASKTAKNQLTRGSSALPR